MSDQAGVVDLLRSYLTYQHGLPRQRIALEKLGECEVTGVLGSGAFGVTFKAFQTSHPQQPFALKMMNPLNANQEVAKSFLRETELLKTLDCRHIVPVIAAGVQENIPWLATQFIDGPSLSEVLRKGPLKIQIVKKLALDLSEALVAGHDQKISHNDLKPANIMLRRASNDFILVDYGLGQYQKIYGRNHDGVFGNGTLFWVAPEQYFGISYMSSDIYSAGLILVQAFTGVNPFVMKTTLSGSNIGSQEVLEEAMRVSTLPVDLSGVPGDWLSVLAGMLERDVVKRFTAVQVRHEFELLCGTPTSQEVVQVNPIFSDAQSNPWARLRETFDSWEQLEQSVQDFVSRNGIDNFRLDVNTDQTMVVSFSVLSIRGDSVLFCTATAHRGHMFSLGWDLDQENERHWVKLSPDVSAAKVAALVSQALQVGFMANLKNVQIML